MRQPLEELVFSSFYSIFRTAGLGLSQPQMEHLRVEARRFSEHLQGEMKLLMIEKLEKVQERLVEAFKVVEDKLKELEKHYSNK